MTENQLAKIVAELRFRAEYYREAQINFNDKGAQDKVLLSMGKEQAYWSAIRIIQRELGA